MGSNNLKDSSTDLSITLKDTNFPISYNKLDKLVTALYMVTDILDKDEPLRHKLRTLSAEIISDIYYTPSNSIGRVVSIVSFLDIASALNLISEMNASILKKELSALRQSIEDYSNRSRISEATLSEFFLEPARNATHSVAGGQPRKQFESMPFSPATSKGQAIARIGVQEGSTLLKALSKVKMSDNKFNELKKERRDKILSLVKNLKGASLDGATITDIRNSGGEVFMSLSEKTLQRELVSMVKDNILYRVGSKRWSKYSIKA